MSKSASKSLRSVDIVEDQVAAQQLLLAQSAIAPDSLPMVLPTESLAQFNPEQNGMVEISKLHSRPSWPPSAHDIEAKKQLAQRWGMGVLAATVTVVDGELQVVRGMSDFIAAKELGIPKIHVKPITTNSDEEREELFLTLKVGKPELDPIPKALMLLRLTQLLMQKGIRRGSAPGIAPHLGGGKKPNNGKFPTLGEILKAHGVKEDDYRAAKRITDHLSPDELDKLTKTPFGKVASNLRKITAPQFRENHELKSRIIEYVSTYPESQPAQTFATVEQIARGRRDADLKETVESYPHQSSAGWDTCRYVDALQGLKSEPDESIDFINLDPDYGVGFPYDGQTYATFDPAHPSAWVNEQLQYLLEAYRILKPDGNIILFGVFPQLYHLIAAFQIQHPQALLDDLDWIHESTRNNPVGTWQCGKRPMVHIRKTQDNQFFGQEAQMEFKAAPSCKHIQEEIAKGNKYRRPLNYFYFNVINNVSKDKNGHPCPLPPELLNYLIKILSKEGDKILDVFAGSGNGLACAKNLGRHYLGFEHRPLYYKRIMDRLGTPILELPKADSTEGLIDLKGVTLDYERREATLEIKPSNLNLVDIAAHSDEPVRPGLVTTVDEVSATNKGGSNETIN